MKIRDILANNSQVEYVIDEIKKQSKILAEDVVCAYNLFSDINPDLNEKALKCLERVYVMCKYMEPAAEDVISMLLFKDFLANRISLHTFSQYFPEEFQKERCKQYYNYMVEGRRNAPKSNPTDDEWSYEDCVSYYIMMRVSDKMFTALIKKMNRNRVSNAIKVSRAYGLAKDAYDWLKSESGEPYIVRPIRVAQILEKVGAESSVIAAALLHDAVEHKKCTLSDIETTCEAKISRYVEALSSLDEDLKEALKSFEYDHDEAELDDKSFQKLVNTIAVGDETFFALYIKAAEIIHNLSTIESTSGIDIRRKNNEIQLVYLPLFKAFKLDYFAQVIEDLMWRAADIERYEKMREKYNEMVLLNRESIDEFKYILGNYIPQEINKYAQLLGSAGFDVEIIERQWFPFEVYNHIKPLEERSESFIKNINKRFVPVCDINIVVDARDYTSVIDTFIAGFAKMFEQKITITGRTIIDFKKGERFFIFIVEDRYRNVFYCKIIMREDYEIQKKGFYAVDDSNKLEEDVVGSDAIRVELRNGKSILLPKGATVIDVAFAIHEEIGCTLKSATINGKKARIYDILVEGDRVIVEADTCRVDGVTDLKRHIPHVRINWLNWVVTKRAKKKITEYLTEKYYTEEGDDPKNESKVQTEIVEASADRILQKIHSAI